MSTCICMEIIEQLWLKKHWGCIVLEYTSIEIPQNIHVPYMRILIKRMGLNAHAWTPCCGWATAIAIVQLGHLTTLPKGTCQLIHIFTSQETAAHQLPPLLRNKVQSQLTYSFIQCIHMKCVIYKVSDDSASFFPPKTW